MKAASAIKEPMVWLMLGIPLLTAVAGIYTLNIALSAKATDEVNIPVTRIAQIQQSDLSADENAARANITAHLNLRGTQWEITSAANLRDSQLILSLQHPIDREKDVRMVLDKKNTAFISNTMIDRSHDWILQLSDVKTHWRLVGRLHKNENTADLKASVSLP